MDSRLREKTTELFASAFHEVVIPALEDMENRLRKDLLDMENRLRKDLASKKDVTRLETKLESRPLNHEKRIQRLENASL